MVVTGWYTIPEQLHHFSSLNDLYTVAETLPEAYRAEIHAHEPDEGEWSKLGYRRSLWLDDEPRVVADVSANTDWYNILQYGDVLEAVGDGIQQYEDAVDVTGYVSLSPSGHKMGAHITFHGNTDIEPRDGEPLHLGLKVQSGHAEFEDLTYSVAATPQEGTHEMAGFISALDKEQTHEQPLQDGLAHDAVERILENPDMVESRLRAAQERRFMDEDEALLVLMGHHINWYIDDPVASLRNTLAAQNDGSAPSLYDAYTAGTRALADQYRTGDTPAYRIDQGLDQAAELLETGGNELPDADELARDALRRRIRTYAEAEDPSEVNRFWRDEPEMLRTLAEQRGVTA